MANVEADSYESVIAYLNLGTDYTNKHYLSFRTEQSVVKNLGNIHEYVYVYVTEILRFALNDTMTVNVT